MRKHQEKLSSATALLSIAVSPSSRLTRTVTLCRSAWELHPANRAQNTNTSHPNRSCRIRADREDG